MRKWIGVVCTPFIEMKPPGAWNAIVDLAKLRDYALSPSHPGGR